MNALNRITKERQLTSRYRKVDKTEQDIASEFNGRLQILYSRSFDTLHLPLRSENTSNAPNLSPVNKVCQTQSKSKCNKLSKPTDGVVSRTTDGASFMSVDKLQQRSRCLGKN